MDKTLSGGERKRVELASILAMQPRVVLMDEPDSGIDVEALTRIFDALADFKEQGATVIMITHSQEVLKHAEHAFLLCDGRIIDKGAVGRIDDYFGDNCMNCGHTNVPTRNEMAVVSECSSPTREQVETARELLASLGDLGGHIKGDDIAHLEVHGNEVVGAHLVPGLQVDVDELDDGIEAWIHLDKGARIAKPVHMCFGMLPTEGLQRIVMHVEAEEDSFASVQAHCTFPNAVDITHKMDADVVIGPGATYEYFERHLHGAEGGVIVVPKTRVHVKEGGRFKTEFELIKGMAGVIDFDYEVDCDAFSTLDMIARIIGRGHDRIRINETGRLNGEGATAVLQSHLALRDDAFAEIYNTLTANAAHARGHVDCKEVVQGNAVAKAVPVVEVTHPLAHVTHEAAIGSVDSKQLQTLMSRGLDEDAATDLIIEGLLG